MSPTSFAFTLTMPGDSRLVGVARLLAAQTASYAKLTADAAESLADQVERATEAAIASIGADTPIEFTFSGDEGMVEIVISCEAVAAGRPPRSASVNGVSVDWKADGARHTCHIRQPIPA